MSGKRARNQIGRPFTRLVKRAQPLEDGKVRCLSCGKSVSLTPNKKMRAHQASDGEPCAYSVSYATRPRLKVLPKVILPPAPKCDPPRERATKSQPERPPSRLDAGSSCVDCGKWLPGERSVCGACSVKRNEARR